MLEASYQTNLSEYYYYILGESLRIYFLEIGSPELVFRSLYMLEILSSSLKSDKVKLVNKIALQAGESLTPALITAMHAQRMAKFPGLDLDEITNSISSIISGSKSLDLTCVFVAIFNGEDIFDEIDIEIRFIFRDILRPVLRNS